VLSAVLVLGLENAHGVGMKMEHQQEMGNNKWQ
jgi:hypothetical protein